MAGQKVLFVCLGNICRSPTAHGVFMQRVQKQGLSQRITVDSAGTAAWHTGKAPDSRSMQAAAARGYDLSSLRARQALRQDFDEFDVILAMDNANLEALQALCPSHFTGHLGLFLTFARNSPADSHDGQVPDPYHGGPEGFEHVLDLVEDASEGLLDFLVDKP